MIKIELKVRQHGALGFYASAKNEATGYSEYLHKDGIIRKTTWHNDYSGYFKTIKDLKNAIQILRNTAEVTATSELENIQELLRTKMTLKVGKTAIGYYILQRETFNYLWRDGTWYRSARPTIAPKLLVAGEPITEMNGYFETIEEVKNAIDKVKVQYEPVDVILVDEQNLFACKHVVPEKAKKDAKLDEDLDFWIDLGDYLINENAPYHWICLNIRHFFKHHFGDNVKKDAYQPYIDYFKEWFDYDKEIVEYVEHWGGGNERNSDSDIDARLMAIAFMYVFTERKAQKKA